MLIKPYKFFWFYKHIYIFGELYSYFNKNSDCLMNKMNIFQIPFKYRREYDRRGSFILMKLPNGTPLWFAIKRETVTTRLPPVTINPLMPVGNYSYQFFISCPRDCVSRHNGGTSGAPLKPLRVYSALRALSTLMCLRGAPEGGTREFLDCPVKELTGQFQMPI